MHTMATHILSWGLKVGRRLNQRETQNIKKSKGGHQKVGETTEKTPKNKKKYNFLTHYKTYGPWNPSGPYVL